MTITLQDLAHPADEVAGRRVRDVASLYQSWLRREVPEEQAQRLIDYALAHDLDLSATSSELFPVRGADQSWSILVTWPGIARLCRKTGLWLPGRSEVRELTLGTSQFFVLGSCHVRQERASTTWIEVSAFARYASHYDRDMEAGDAHKAKPLGDWAIIPEIKLDEVAQYLAAAKAFGDYVTRHQFFYAVPRIKIHDEMIRQHIHSRSGG